MLNTNYIDIIQSPVVTSRCQPVMLEEGDGNVVNHIVRMSDIEKVKSPGWRSKRYWRLHPNRCYARSHSGSTLQINGEREYLYQYLYQ